MINLTNFNRSIAYDCIWLIRESKIPLTTPGFDSTLKKHYIILCHNFNGKKITPVPVQPLYSWNWGIFFRYWRYQETKKRSVWSKTRIFAASTITQYWLIQATEICLVPVTDRRLGESGFSFSIIQNFSWIVYRQDKQLGR